MSLPWSKVITYLMYGVYVFITAVLLIGPRKYGKTS